MNASLRLAMEQFCKVWARGCLAQIEAPNIEERGPRNLSGCVTSGDGPAFLSETQI